MLRVEVLHVLPERGSVPTVRRTRKPRRPDLLVQHVASFLPHIWFGTCRTLRKSEGEKPKPSGYYCPPRRAMFPSEMSRLREPLVLALSRSTTFNTFRVVVSTLDDYENMNPSGPRCYLCPSSSLYGAPCLPNLTNRENTQSSRRP